MTEKEIRKLQKSFTGLTETVIVFLARLDEIYKEPATVERGRKVARLCNALEDKNDWIRHFVLDLPIDEKTKDRIYRREKGKAKRKNRNGRRRT